MTESEIYSIKQPCLNRSLKLENNKDGTVTINGLLFTTYKDCEDYLETVKRTDIPSMEDFLAEKQRVAEIITAQIATTNNGKLLKSRLPCAALKHIPALIEEGVLKRATFMYCGDAVALGDKR